MRKKPGTLICVRDKPAKRNVGAKNIPGWSVFECIHLENPVSKMVAIENTTLSGYSECI